MSGRGSVPASGLTHTEQNEAGLGISAHRDPMWGMGRDIWGEDNFPRNISHGERCSSGCDGPDGGSQGGKKKPPAAAGSSTWLLTRHTSCEEMSAPVPAAKASGGLLVKLVLSHCTS